MHRYISAATLTCILDSQSLADYLKALVVQKSVKIALFKLRVLTVNNSNKNIPCNARKKVLKKTNQNVFVKKNRKSVTVVSNWKLLSFFFLMTRNKSDLIGKFRDTESRLLITIFPPKQEFFDFFSRKNYFLSFSARFWSWDTSLTNTTGPWLGKLVEGLIFFGGGGGSRVKVQTSLKVVKIII